MLNYVHYSFLGRFRKWNDFLGWSLAALGVVDLFVTGGSIAGGDLMAMHVEGFEYNASFDASYNPAQDFTLPTPALHFSDCMAISWLVRTSSHTLTCESRSLLEDVDSSFGPKYKPQLEMAL